jgi:hypothetical protein
VVPRSRSYKKERKRTLITFLEKPHPLHPPPQSPINLPVGIRESIGSKKPFLQKRKKKNVSNVLRETPLTHPSPIPLTLSVSTSKFQRSGVLRSRSYQKEGKEH